MDQENELEELRAQIRDDRKLIRKAADALAEIDRGAGLSDAHADVLAALRIRVEGKKRASLEELLEAAGDISGKKDLTQVLDSPAEPNREWPVIEEKKKEWPGL